VQSFRKTIDATVSVEFLQPENTAAQR
jgi:hypothetical protein